tara:strand:+ start:178 stop:1032 length:855 start_codon:yes stop_codon:yes gene_type:complete
MIIKKLHDDFGISIENIDVNYLSAIEKKEIIDLFDEHSLIVIKKQKINEQEQVNFTKIFGELEITKPGTLGTNSNLVILTNIDENGNIVDTNHKQSKNDRANQQWHSDSSFKIRPAHASILSGKQVPKEGGNTEFVSMRVVYKNLQKDIQEKVLNLEAVHHFAYSRSKIDIKMVSQIEYEKFPPVVQPMVKTNPKNNKRALYFGSHTAYIKDIPEKESTKLLTYLKKFSSQKKFIYSHTWEENDLLIWDNRSILHRGTDYNPKEPRYLIRTTVQDSLSKAKYLN